MTGNGQNAHPPNEVPERRRMLRASVRSARESLADVVEHLNAATLDVDLAVDLVEHFDKVARIAEAGKAVAARRVALSNRWKRDGQRSPAHWIAKETGTTVGAAAATLETAAALEGLPETDQAVRTGKLSTTQATHVAAAAATDPRAEAQLLEAAEHNDIAGLKEECARVKAAVVVDESARYRAQHRRRHLRTWTDHDGSGRGTWSLPPDLHARFLAALGPHERAAFDAARREGRDENPDAYRADALVALASQRSQNARVPGDDRGDRASTDTHTEGRGEDTAVTRRDNESDSTTGGEASAPGSADQAVDGAGDDSNRSSPGPRATIHVRVDHAALVRGHTERHERCEIPGVGPVPVATARSLLGDALLTAFVTDGTDIRSLVHLGRTATADQCRALEQRDATCAVPDCSVSEHLEIDHVTGWAITGTTTLDDLARLCHWHHYLKTHHGYTLHGPPNGRQWEPPEKPPPDTHLPRPPHERRSATAARRRRAP